MDKILIIGDDKDRCLVLSRFLSKNSFSTSVAHRGEDGLRLLRTSEYSLILCDNRLPDHTGVEMLRKIKVLQPSVAVIIINGCSDVHTAVETFRYGASDYMTKPLYPDELLITINETIAKSGNSSVSEGAVNGKVKTKRSTFSAIDFIIGKSVQSQAVRKYVELIAPSEISVIIHGETGTGKEFVAQSIHQLSERAEGPFIAMDCGALTSDLAGSELFGHVKGAFTGAIADKTGCFEAADGGTILLDEIGNLSYENQVKLLRVIQERRIKRIGATKDSAINVRIISATNEDLAKAVKEGRFREDLYHRLNEFKIQLSPLRERKDDILVFACYFLEKANHSLRKSVKFFSSEALNQILNHYWHGNLRELNNVVRRAVLLTTGEVVEPDSLPQEIITAHAGVACGGMMEDTMGMLKSAAGSAERQAIIEVLGKVNYNKTKAAEVLRIDRKTLYNKLKLYSIL